MRRSSFAVILALSSCVMLLCGPTVVMCLDTEPAEPADIQCEICQAVIQQISFHGPKLPPETKASGGSDRIANKRRTQLQSYEALLFEVMEGMCQVKYFSRYEFPPPKMIKACELFMEEHSDDVERAFVQGLPERTIRQQVCLDTHICPHLWSHEEEERKRERTPQEVAAEAERNRLAHEEAAKKERAKKRQEKAKAKADAEAAKAKQTTTDTSSTHEGEL